MSASLDKLPARQHFTFSTFVLFIQGGINIGEICNQTASTIQTGIQQGADAASNATGIGRRLLKGAMRTGVVLA